MWNTICIFLEALVICIKVSDEIKTFWIYSNDVIEEKNILSNGYGSYIC